MKKLGVLFEGFVRLLFIGALFYIIVINVNKYMDIPYIYLAGIALTALFLSRYKLRVNCLNGFCNSYRCSLEGSTDFLSFRVDYV